MFKLFKPHWLEIAISILFTLIIFGSLQYFTRGQFADPDGFYHAKTSQILQEGHLGDTFPWLAFTTWKDNYADQHYLYHVLLTPFNTVDTIHISVVVFATLFIICFYLLLIKLQVNFKFFWIILVLLGSTDFLFRINLVKANTVSLALVCLIVFFTIFWHQHRKIWTAGAITVSSIVFVWTYGGFVFIPLILGMYMLVVLVTKRKFDIVPLSASLVGILLGILLHPHSSHLLTLLYDQIFLTGLGAGSKVPAGNEWLPFNINWFIESNVPLLLVWALSLVISFYQLFNKKIDLINIWMQSTTIFLLVLTLWHRRLIEYFVPFVILSSAITLTPYIIKLRWKEVKAVLVNYWPSFVAMTFIIIIFIGGFVYNYTKVQNDLSNGQLSSEYEEVSIAIKKDSEVGDIVINTQWDQFPQLFYWNSKNYYPVGMDPTFMYIYDSNKYWAWRSIADDENDKWKSIDDLYNTLKNTLRAKYLFIDTNRNSNISLYIDENDINNQYFLKFYDTGGLTVYKIVE